MKENGYVLLLSVLVLTGMGVLVAVGTLTMGIFSSSNSYDLILSNKSKSVVNGCVEDVLYLISGNNAFTGSGTASYVDGDCNYTVVNFGSGKSIEAEVVVGDVYRKVVIEVDQLTPSINVSSWQEEV